MNRSKFLQSSLLALPTLSLANSLASNNTTQITPQEPFVVNANVSRFGEVVKFMGVHPNDLKVSGKDTNGQLCIFEYKGYDTIGPALHVHFKQDEIFTITSGKYRFVVGNQTHELSAGQTIFLPKNVPHTWLQLTKQGSMIYVLQPAGKMEAFFTAMNNLKGQPTPDEFQKLHLQHDMKVVGAPLSL